MTKYPHDRRGPGPRIRSADQASRPAPCWSPRETAIVREYFRLRKLPWLLAVAAGWYPTRYNGKLGVYIPATHQYWQVRLLEGSKRYVSAPYPRGAAVVQFGVLSGAVSVVEGPMDALALWATGLYDGVVAMLGATPSRDVYAMLAEQEAAYIVIPDADAVAEAAAWHQALTHRGAKATIKLLPVGVKDAAEFLESSGPDALRDWAQTDLASC